jgi:hypothetical protein
MVSPSPKYNEITPLIERLTRPLCEIPQNRHFRYSNSPSLCWQSASRPLNLDTAILLFRETPVLLPNSRLVRMYALNNLTMGLLTRFNYLAAHPHDNQKPRRFRTRKIISSFGAEPLRGWGTRVFEAIEVDENDEKGAPVVLKDIWIDHDRMREGDILAQLYDKADDEDKKVVKKHYLTTICHGDVLVETDTADDTRDLMRRLKTTEDNVFELQKKESMVPRHEGTSGSQVTYPGKAHYRILLFWCTVLTLASRNF